MRKINRRQLLASTAAATTAAAFAPYVRSETTAANSKLNIACVGVGGKGWSDMHETSVGQNIVAICDVDQSRLDRAAEAFPQANRYNDWRLLLEQNDIDAVTVSTPDHMHAPVAMSAMALGKHVYCQKPLCHDVYEARQLTQAAAEHQAVTQMGIQHHSTSRFKTTVKLLRSGILGKISEAHVWTDRPGTYWQQAFDRPTGADAVPETLAWDHWLGVAPRRSYKAETYHPFKWRAFWDFGTGALGDMGCHGMDPVIYGLRLGPPKRITSQTSPLFADTAPAWSVITYEFSASAHTGESFTMVWYDGGKRPAEDLIAGSPGDLSNGILVVGDRGRVAVDYENMPRLLPADEYADFTIEAEPADNHYQQWVAACKGDGQTSTPFSYAGPLTETVLLGNLAVRLARPVEWDSDQLKVRGQPEAEPLIRRSYREGWSVNRLS